jgi:hypothetical protein
MTAKSQINGNTDIGGATNSAPRTPIDFLKQYEGKTVKIKAKGIFIEDLLNRQGRTLKSEYLIGTIEGKYRVMSSFGEILLRYPYHSIAVRQLDFIEINGKEVRGEQNE